MRTISTIAWLAVFAVGSAATYRFGPWFKGGDDKEARFETAELGRGAIVAKVTASGTLSALVTVQVGSQVSGRIKELHADFNSEVKQGEVIAKIDPQLFSAALEQARANHNAAQGELLKAKVQALDADRQLTRTKSLAQRNLVAQADLDTSQSNADVARAQIAAAAGRLDQARAALHQAEVNLTYTTINSPIDGVVISRNVDVGQTVAASMQAPILFVIAEDLRRMHVDTSVAEADVGKLQPGMKASFNVDAYPSERFEGVVRQIRNAPQTLQNVVTYDAVIDVDNPDLKLRPGMTANATFVYAERTNSLRVPNAALRFRPSADLLEPRGSRGGAGKAAAAGGKAAAAKAAAAKAALKPADARSQHRTVWLLRGNKPEAVEITTGITDGSYTEVVAGALQGGETLITDTANAAKSTTGMPMRRVL